MAVSVVFAAVGAPVALVLFRLVSIAHPEGRQKGETDTHEQADEALRDRADATKRNPAWARWVLDVLHDVADDIYDLRR